MDSCKCDNPDHHQYQAALGEWSITEEGWTPCVIYKSVCRYCMTMYINDLTLLLQVFHNSLCPYGINFVYIEDAFPLDVPT